MELGDARGGVSSTPPGVARHLSASRRQAGPVGSLSGHRAARRLATLGGRARARNDDSRHRMCLPTRWHMSCFVRRDEGLRMRAARAPSDEGDHESHAPRAESALASMFVAFPFGKPVSNFPRNALISLYAAPQCPAQRRSRRNARQRRLKRTLLEAHRGGGHVSFPPRRRRNTHDSMQATSGARCETAAKGRRVGERCRELWRVAPLHPRTVTGRDRRGASERA